MNDLRDLNDSKYKVKSLNDLSDSKYKVVKSI